MPQISAYPPSTKSSLLATVILFFYQDSFTTPISIQEFIFDFKQNFTLPDVESYDQVLLELGIAEILKYLMHGKAICIMQDVLGYELKYFIKSKDSSRLRNLLNTFSHCLPEEKGQKFDQFYESFDKKFANLSSKFEASANLKVDANIHTLE